MRLPWIDAGYAWIFDGEHGILAVSRATLAFQLPGSPKYPWFYRIHLGAQPVAQVDLFRCGFEPDRGSWTRLTISLQNPHPKLARFVIGGFVKRLGHDELYRVRPIAAEPTALYVWQASNRYHRTRETSS